MQDLQSKSLWSQVSGECIQGDMIGARLNLFPSIFTTFEEFRELYPHGVLLQKPAKGDSGSHYNQYFIDKEKLGIFGRINSFERLDGKDMIYGLRLDDKTVAVSRNFLKQNGLARIENDEIIVLYLPDDHTVLALKNNDDIKKHLPPPGSPPAADLIEKLDKGKLKYIPVISSFWFAWVSFFPETELIN